MYPCFRTITAFLLAPVLALVLALPASAQDGGRPISPSATTQFVYQNGEVVQRTNGKTTRLTQNVRLPGGTKINYKSGMVELLGGKIITLRPGDYVKADGGVVFATPGSAAYARNDQTVPADAKYEPFVLVGAASANTTEQLRLLQKKVDLLTRKVALLSAGQTPPPAAAALDAELQETDEALAKLAKPAKQGK